MVIDSHPLSISANGRILGFGSSIFNLGGQTQGWMKVTSDLPIVGFELLNAEDAANQAWGLAAIESQPSGLELVFDHYTVATDWWTLFAVANLNETTVANVRLKTFGNDGSISAMKDKSIPANGRLSDFLLQLLGP
jgi:hypothetical protein